MYLLDEHGNCSYKKKGSPLIGVSYTGLTQQKN